MLPLLSATSYVPIQAPLINTALPGSAVTHVPYDNVAPAPSEAQAENNTAPNIIVTQDAGQQAAVAAAADEQAFSAPGGGVQQSQDVGVQAAFLAQLLAQDGSPETGSVLVQYEKLLALGNVKYKPSNALKPPEDNPASAFGRILQQEHAQVQPVQAPPVAQQQPSPPPQEAQSAPAEPPAPDFSLTLPAAANTPPPQAFTAYAATLIAINAAPATATEVA